MKISTKLSVLIAAAALLALSLYGLIGYRAYSNIQFQRLLNSGLDYLQPLRALGEGMYKHQLAALAAKRQGGADTDALNRADEALRQALEQLSKVNREIESRGYGVPDLSALRTAIDRLLALRPRPDTSMSVIAQAHEAAFVQLRQAFQKTMVAFQVLQDTEEDITLLGDLQFELLPTVLAARATLISRVFIFDDARAEGSMSAAVLRGLNDGIQRQIGALVEISQRHASDVSRIARADPSKRGWERHVQPASAVLERVQRYPSAIAEVLTSPKPAASLVEEDEASLAAFLGGWRALSINVEEALAARLDANTRDFYLQSVVIGAIMTVLFFAMWWIVRGVTRDINAAETITGRIAEGDLDIDVPGTERPDEIGGLSRSVEVLRENSIKQRTLQENERAHQEQEREMMAHMSQTATRVAESVQAIRAASGEISQGSSDLASRTERQASALQETVATMTEISATISMNAQNSEKSRQLAAEALASAEDGGKAVASVVTAMTGIENSSARIAAIIQVMEEISFQTKLLALNAAVEAARAGETGKGFAVVAQEVRSLADRSRQASQQIRDLIGESSKEVGQGVKLSGEAGEALTSIIDTVRRVAEIAPEIAAGSREQARSITEINKALSDLDAATQQNAALVEESSAAAASLADQAGQLVTVVSSFRSDDGTAAAGEETTGPAPKRQRRRLATVGGKGGEWDEEEF